MEARAKFFAFGEITSDGRGKLVPISNYHYAHSVFPPSLPPSQFSAVQQGQPLQVQFPFIQHLPEKVVLTGADLAGILLGAVLGGFKGFIATLIFSILSKTMLKNIQIELPIGEIFKSAPPPPFSPQPQQETFGWNEL